MVFVVSQNNTASGLSIDTSRVGKNRKMLLKDYFIRQTSISTPTTTLTSATQIKTKMVCISKSLSSNPKMTKQFIYQSISSHQSPLNTNHPSKLQSCKTSAKLLRRSKKYHLNNDSLMKQNNQTIAQKDVHTLLSTLQKDKEQKDQIISTLRNKFSQAHSKILKKQFSLQKAKPYQLKNQYMNYINQCTQNKQAHTSDISKNSNSSNSHLGTQEMKYNHSEFFTKSRELNLQIKNFKNQLKTYINNFLSTEIDQQKHKNHHHSNTDSYRKLTSRNIKRHHATISGEERLSEQSSKETTHKLLSNSVFKEYMFLAQKSYNSLEMLMKSSFALSQSQNGDDSSRLAKIPYTKQQMQHALAKIDKKLTLATLKSTYQCLQPQFNSKQVVNKILLALGINPMNEFYLVPQQSFSAFKKLSKGKCSRKECRQFLLRYFCYDHEKIKKEHFEGSVYSLLKKLSCWVNERTVERLFQEWKCITQQMIMLSIGGGYEVDSSNTTITQQNNLQQSINPKNFSNPNLYYTRSQIKSILTNDPIFLWQQILRLIFLV